MMGVEFTGELPFTDVPIHSIIQAPDGRRMSKSLGTGIDPLDEIEQHGADALRFGLLAMSSTQDVRYSAERVRQGRDLANKLWNASRLILLGVQEGAEPSPDHAETVEDRWILSRLDRVTARVDELIDVVRASRRRRWSCTTSSGRSCATGTSSWSSRASTTRTPTAPASRPRCSSRWTACCGCCTR